MYFLSISRLPVVEQNTLIQNLPQQFQALLIAEGMTPNNMTIACLDGIRNTRRDIFLLESHLYLTIFSRGTYSNFDIATL